MIARRTDNHGVPYVLGDDLLGGVGEVEVDEIGEGGHGDGGGRRLLAG